MLAAVLTCGAALQYADASLGQGNDRELALSAVKAASAGVITKVVQLIGDEVHKSQICCKVLLLKSRKRDCHILCI